MAQWFMVSFQVISSGAFAVPSQFTDEQPGWTPLLGYHVIWLTSNPLSKLIGLSYTIELTPQGDVSKIIDVNEVLSIVKGTSQAHMTGARLFEESAIKQRHQIPVLVTTHEKQMRPGDSWSSVKTLSFGMMGSKSYERIYTLEEVKNMNGQKIAVVNMKAVPPKGDTITSSKNP